MTTSPAAPATSSSTISAIHSHSSRGPTPPSSAPVSESAAFAAASSDGPVWSALSGVTVGPTAAMPVEPGEVGSLGSVGVRPAIAVSVAVSGADDAVLSGVAVVVGVVSVVSGAGDVTWNCAMPTRLDCCPTASMRCSPGGRSSGTSNSTVTFPPSLAVTSGSGIGSEYRVTFTVSPGVKPANNTFCFAPGSSAVDWTTSGETVVGTAPMTSVVGGTLAEVVVDGVSSPGSTNVTGRWASCESSSSSALRV